MFPPIAPLKYAVAIRRGPTAASTCLPAHHCITMMMQKWRMPAWKNTDVT